jgi:tRNA G18 (ribose-2'-O)-methylase SpoU
MTKPPRSVPLQRYQVLECTNPTCRLRYPVDLGLLKRLSCPRCGAPVRAAANEFANQKQLPHFLAPGGPEVEALLDNIRSMFNVGAMFRTADGAGLRRLHLCGITPPPGNPGVAKTSLGAEQTVAWEYHPNALEAAQALKAQGLRVWALEGTARSQSLFELPDLPGPPVLLVVGNELSGVDPGLLALCDQVIAIPMQGAKRSLNVAIAFAVATYFLRLGVNIR